LRARCGLPAYSPDFHPIELAFANLKTSLRAQTARTVADLGETIEQDLRRFTTVECHNYVVAAGYDAFDPT
jgi:transposase